MIKCQLSAAEFKKEKKKKKEFGIEKLLLSYTSTVPLASAGPNTQQSLLTIQGACEGHDYMAKSQYLDNALCSCSV